MAFTSIEWLVVIAIIAILAALLHFEQALRKIFGGKTPNPNVPDFW